MITNSIVISLEKVTDSLPPPPPLSLVNVIAANFLGKTSAGAAFSGGKNMSDARINGLAGAGGGGIIAQLITFPLQTVSGRDLDASTQFNLS